MRAKTSLSAVVLAIAVLFAASALAAGVAPLVDAVKSMDRTTALKLIEQRVNVCAVHDDVVAQVAMIAPVGRNGLRLRRGFFAPMRAFLLQIALVITHALVIT